jgi:pyridoxamine 5'-phosphate oxidase
MIDIQRIGTDKPHQLLKSFYEEALYSEQNNVEAILVASYSLSKNEVDARYVNLKSIIDNNFIFFSNYESPKAKQFKEHNQVSAVLFWNNINIQIRMKGKVKKLSKQTNTKYFIKRSEEKNALAISSNQSKLIDSYNRVKENYNKSLKNDNLKKCPEYWGGFSFTPYYFEFWEGHESRINKREVYEKIHGVWKHSFLQP